jgi:hypothetical protein
MEKLAYFIEHNPIKVRRQKSGRVQGFGLHRIIYNRQKIYTLGYAASHSRRLELGIKIVTD